MAKGLVRVAQRCGKNAYRWVTVRVTNPDHLEAGPAPTGPTLDINEKYQQGRKPS